MRYSHILLAKKDQAKIVMDFMEYKKGYKMCSRVEREKMEEQLTWYHAIMKELKNPPRDSGDKLYQHDLSRIIGRGGEVCVD
jgi:hypothetical protein